ncbi:HAD-superfamily hydrolase, subfamily IIA [Bacillus sp. JCM 19046]|nr:HAD-superfamily hydrolase, subfamily IIA [Bacillus sp. JCM 19045]GAF15686.1 HAD-superfamily hydrolase, subfamily IIA [Bacillus sp. JCM 19046]
MRHYDHYFFDLDGTLIHGKALLPKAADLITYLYEQDKQVFFLTNHPVRSRTVLAKYLQDLGLSVSFDQLITPVAGLKEYIRFRHKGDRKLFVVGSKMIKEDLCKSGFSVVEDSTEDSTEMSVVLGMSPDLTYSQLQEGFWLMQRGAELILLNEDLLCPHPDGFLIDTGSLARVLQHVNKDPVVVGKPSSWMQQAMRHRTGDNLQKAVIVGDSLASDIGIGNALGIDSVLVCSGVTSVEQIRHAVQTPTTVFPSIREVYQTIKG